MSEAQKEEKFMVILDGGPKVPAITGTEGKKVVLGFPQEESEKYAAEMNAKAEDLGLKGRYTICPLSEREKE